MQDVNKTFTIVTYNIFDGRKTNQIIHNILRLIQDGAHIVCLQEVWPLYRNVDIRKLLAERLPPHFQWRYFVENGANWYDYGVGMLWDANVFSNQTWNQLSLPLLNKLSLWNKLFFWVLGITPRTFKRGALIGTFTFQQRTVRITNLHLDFQGGSHHRASQIKSLMEYLGAQPQVEHEIICGDFNTLGLFNKKEKILSLEKQLENGFRSVMSKPYNSATVQQLDYIFAKNLKAHKAGLLKLSGSDHHPLLAELST